MTQKLLPIWVAAFAVLAVSAHAGDLPDLSKTPGASRPLSKHTICTTKWGLDARHVSAAMKRDVFASYGYSGNTDPQCVPDAHGRHCEIDHLVSRELGGDDVVTNLWPQSYGGQPWNAVRKDKLENRLHKEVCAGHLSLKAARQMIVTDWTAAYLRYYPPP
jgi:hypothetical protein